MSAEEKFRAAVNVIRNLPKNGPVQPSHHVMLKFYAYYKQATEGPNVSSKPQFWEVVKKAKWDAWIKLGSMDKETAMKNYVDEFKKIVETVWNSDVDNIDQAEVDSFYANVPVADLELLVGKAIVNKARSRSSSPVPITEEELNSSQKSNGTANGYDYSYTNGVNGRSDEEDEDEEFFLDTIEQNSDQGSVKLLKTNVQLPYMNGYAFPVRDETTSGRKCYSNVDNEMNQHISLIITSLQKDLEKVVKSVNLIEERIGQLQGKIVLANSKQAHNPYITSRIIPFIVLFSWPVILQLLLAWFRKRNK